jgi:quercetin dioxygenase-like cupin family protein
MMAVGGSEVLVKRRVMIVAVFALAMGLAIAGLALATPGSGAVNVELARASMPKFTAHFVNRDIVVTEFSFAPGGTTGWHSHPGKVIVGVARGSITLYRGDDPACAGTTYHAGDIWIEHPGVVHEARNEGTVGAVVNATYLGVPVGGSPRIDEAKPANCA